MDSKLLDSKRFETIRNDGFATFGIHAANHFGSRLPPLPLPRLSAAQASVAAALSHPYDALRHEARRVAALPAAPVAPLET